MWLALKPVIPSAVCRCFATFWTHLRSAIKYCCFAIFQLIYLNYRRKNRTTYFAFDNQHHLYSLSHSISVIELLTTPVFPTDKFECKVWIFILNSPFSVACDCQMAEPFLNFSPLLSWKEVSYSFVWVKCIHSVLRQYPKAQKASIGCQLILIMYYHRL